MPGWMSPANLTWGMCRLVQYIPSKSQIALALRGWSVRFGYNLRTSKHTPKDRSRRGTPPNLEVSTHPKRLGYPRRKTHPIAPVKDAREPPWLVLKRLDIHNLDQQQIARRGALNLKGPGEVVDLCEVHVFDVVGRVIVLDLSASPGEVSDCS